MLKVILLRHSITEGNKKKRYIGITDEPLCQEGIALIQQKNYPQGAQLFASPLKRCVQTASILYPGQLIHTIDDLSECDFGEFENQNYMELADNPHYQEWIDSNGQLPFPGGESREEFKKRCLRGFERAVTYGIREDVPSIAIVAHGGTIMSIMEEYAQPSADYYHWQVSNGCGYMVQLDVQEWKRGAKRLRVLTNLP